MDDEKAVVQSISLPLYESKGWIKFLGVIFIIYGIISILTIVGALIGWLPLWIGIVLNKAAKAADSAHVTGSADTLREALLKLKTFFTIYGVLVLIGLILIVIWGFVMLATGGALLQGLSGF